jgi:tRNA(adenine34) deaminase
MDFEEIMCADDDHIFMREAIREAKLAAEAGEVPVGAVIVRDGSIIARAHNMVETEGRSGAHAEMLVIEAAERLLGTKWLPDTTLYVTLEPCSMCAGAMVLARIPRLVIGAPDPKTGACGSVINVAANEALNHRIEIRRGVLAEECGEQLREFFRSRRGRKQITDGGINQ